MDSSGGCNNCSDWGDIFKAAVSGHRPWPGWYWSGCSTLQLILGLHSYLPRFSARRAARCGPSITCGRFSLARKPKSIIVPASSITSTNGRRIVQKKLKRRYQYEPGQKCAILGKVLGDTHIISRSSFAFANFGVYSMGGLGFCRSRFVDCLGRYDSTKAGIFSWVRLLGALQIPRRNKDIKWGF